MALNIVKRMIDDSAKMYVVGAYKDGDPEFLIKTPKLIVVGEWECCVIDSWILLTFAKYSRPRIERIKIKAEDTGELFDFDINAIPFEESFSGSDGRDLAVRIRKVEAKKIDQEEEEAFAFLN